MAEDSGGAAGSYSWGSQGCGHTGEVLGSALLFWNAFFGGKGRALLGEPKPFFSQESPNLGGKQLLKYLHRGFNKLSGAWHPQCRCPVFPGTP